jgi:hypothetical protein
MKTNEDVTRNQEPLPEEYDGPLTEQSSGNENRAQKTENVSPIFEEIKGMDVGGAVNVLIQVAQQSQSAGVLTIRDSVVVAHAISILHPGSI